MNILKKFINQPKKVRPKKLFLYDRLHEILRSLPTINKCLDIGSGRGDLYTKINSKEYIGIDIDEEVLFDARRKFPEVDFRFKNFKDINVNDYMSDLIICIQVIGFNSNFEETYENDLENFFNKLFKTLNSQGFLLISINDKMFKEVQDKKYFKIFEEVKSISYSSINYRMPYMFAYTIKKVMEIVPNLLFFKLNHIMLLRKN